MFSKAENEFPAYQRGIHICRLHSRDNRLTFSLDNSPEGESSGSHVRNSWNTLVPYIEHIATVMQQRLDSTDMASTTLSISVLSTSFIPTN